MFFAEDFNGRCPLCESRNRLWFSSPAALLMRRSAELAGGVVIERAYETTELRCAEDWQLRLPDSRSFAERSAWLLLPAATYILILLVNV